MVGANLTFPRHGSYHVIKPTLAAVTGLFSAGRNNTAPIRFTPGRIKTELLSGLTVALALVPEAVAFAFVVGVHPLVGLYAAYCSYWQGSSALANLSGWCRIR